MKNKITQLLIFLLLTILSKYAKSQEVATDNEGASIFAVPSTKKIIPEVALNNLGVNFTIANLKKVKYFVMDAGQKQYTMTKSTTINFKANLSNNNADDALLIQKGMKLTPHFELGINRGFDELINPSRISTYYTFSMAITGDYQNLDSYDTINKLFLPTNKRLSVGGNLKFNVFFKTNAALALYLTYKNSIETDNLKTYQKNLAGEIYTDNNIVSNGDENGYVGPLSTSNNWRFSVSYPVFFKEKFPVAVIPYYFVKFNNENKPKNNAGILFTILNSAFRNFDRPSGTFDQAKRYEFASAFSIGVNFISTGTAKHNFLFLSGTVSFGKATNDKDNESDKSNNVF